MLALLPSLRLLLPSRQRLPRHSQASPLVETWRDRELLGRFDFVVDLVASRRRRGRNGIDHAVPGNPSDLILSIQALNATQYTFGSHVNLSHDL
jgi:hypothetical protein